MSSEDWLSEFEDAAFGAEPESEAEATFDKNEYLTENFHHSFGVDLPISKRRQYVELVEGIIDNNLPPNFGYFDKKPELWLGGDLKTPQSPNQEPTLGMTDFRNRYVTIDDAQSKLSRAKTMKTIYSILLVLGIPFWILVPIVGDGDIEAGFMCNLCFIPVMLFAIWTTFVSDYEEELQVAIEDGALREGSGYILDKQTNSYLVYNYDRKEVYYSSILQFNIPAEYILSTAYSRGDNDSGPSWWFCLDGVSKTKVKSQIRGFGSKLELYPKLNKICPGLIRFEKGDPMPKWMQKQLESRMDEVNRMISIENEKTNQLLNKGK